MEFQFPRRLKNATFVMMALGLLAIIIGWIVEPTGHGHGGHTRWWANVLVCGFFFFAVALGAMFFYALQYATETGWSSQVKRIFEAMSQYIPIGLGIILIVLICGAAHMHHLYHWMDTDITYEYMVPGVDGAAAEYTNDGTVAGAVENPDYDHIIAGKKPYFGWFFWLRTIIYCVTFVVFMRLFRKWSLQEDQAPDLDLHYKQYRRSALFLVFFAFFSSTMAWDWLMSIDTHWFSTLYGWYIFSGMWVSTMIFATVLILWLKKRGNLPKVNDSHIHDLGKWVFAISMLWSYLWFSQFMLIWYSNIPEEVIYFITRLGPEFKWPFLITFAINFAVPFYVLIARDAKRNPNFLLPVAFLIFVMHFVDVYLLVVPGTVGPHWADNGFMIYEWGMFLGFLGLFIQVTMRSLEKAPLVPKNHPFLDESEHHSI